MIYLLNGSGHKKLPHQLLVYLWTSFWQINIIFTEKRGKTRNGNIFCVKFFFFVISRKIFYTYSVINIVWIVVEKKIKYVLESSWCVLLAKWMSLSKYLLIFEKLTQTFVQFFFTQTLFIISRLVFFFILVLLWNDRMCT